MVQLLQESPRIISVLGIYDRSNCVGIIGDSELELYYLAHIGGFIYVVGKLDKCKKNDKEYLNLRPRGWLIVQVSASDEQVEKKNLHDRKNKNR